MIGRAPEGTIVIGDPNNPFTISLSTALKSAARAVFTVTIGSITVSDSFSVGAGATSFSILGSSIPDPRIYTKGQTAVVTLTLPGTIGTITQTIKLDSRPLSDPVVKAANPLRALTTLKDIPLLTAFDKYFYFVGAIPGSMGALEKYFINAPGRMTQLEPHPNTFNSPTRRKWSWPRLMKSKTSISLRRRQSGWIAA